VRVSKCLAGENGRMDMDKTLLQEEEKKSCTRAFANIYCARGKPQQKLLNNEKIDYTFSVL